MFYTREANQIIKKLQNCEGVTLHFFLIPLISFLAQNSDTFRASKVHWCKNYWLRQQLCLTPPSLNHMVHTQKSWTCHIFARNYECQCFTNQRYNLLWGSDYRLEHSRPTRQDLGWIKPFRDLHRLLDVDPRNLFFFSGAPNRKYNKYAIEF